MNIDLCCVEIIHHFLIDYKRTGGYGRKQSASCHNAGQGRFIYVLLLKRFVDMLHAVFELIHYPSVALELFKRVTDGRCHDLSLIIENSDLCRGRTRIDN